MREKLKIQRYYPEGKIRNTLTENLDALTDLDTDKHYVLLKKNKLNVSILLDDVVQGNVRINSGNIIKEIKLRPTALVNVNLSLDEAISKLRMFIGWELYLI